MERGCGRINIWLAAILAITPASAQVMSGAGGGVSTLFAAAPTSSNGNGADTTEDTIAACGYTVSAAQLASIGDRLHIVAAGNFAASTDNKTARIKLGGVTQVSVSGTTAGQTSWRSDTYFVKNGSNTQVNAGFGAANANITNTTSTGALTDTNTIAITVTGQNATTATANSITCTLILVEFTP